MKQKHNLLSIGEMSKLTDVGIKSLRYYERINLLKPAYINPDSGYRYYSFEQSYMIGMIQFAIAMDFPLRELLKLMNDDGDIDFIAFGLHAKDAAEKKIKSLQKGLNFINVVGNDISWQEKYPFDSVYTREIDKKYIYLVPFNDTFDDPDLYEMVKPFTDSPYYKEVDGFDWMESGYILERSPDGIRRFIFLEIAEERAGDDCIVLPSGLYHCRKSRKSQIEQGMDLLKDYIINKDSFFFIETEFFSGLFNDNNATTELRVVDMAMPR